MSNQEILQTHMLNRADMALRVTYARLCLILDQYETKANYVLTDLARDVKEAIDENESSEVSL